jgi:hypothetical protein
VDCLEVGAGEGDGCIKNREALLNLEDLPFVEIIGILSPLAVGISPEAIPPEIM